MRVYLAGPIFQCEDNECIAWRNEAKQKLVGFDVLDPMARDYRGSTDENFKRIVEEDKAAIDTCDVLLVNHLKPSVGTSMEILYSWERGKQVIAISNNSTVSPWLIYHCHRIFRTLDESTAYLKAEFTK